MFDINFQKKGVSEPFLRFIGVFGAHTKTNWSLIEARAAVRCSVLQCIAACCSVLQCVAACCSVLGCVAVCCSVLQCTAVCCSVLQCVAATDSS